VSHFRVVSSSGHRHTHSQSFGNYLPSSSHLSSPLPFWHSSVGYLRVAPSHTQQTVCSSSSRCIASMREPTIGPPLTTTHHHNIITCARVCVVVVMLHTPVPGGCTSLAPIANGAFA